MVKTKTLHFHCRVHGFDPWAVAAHSSTLAWKIPWVEEPGRLQSMGSLRVVFLPGESQGRGSLVGCRLWGRTESSMTEVT